MIKPSSFLLLLFLPLVAFAYTSPGRPSGFVNDFAGVFTAQEKEALEAKLRSFADFTGPEIVVAAVKSLEGDIIENYANELFAEWGIGKKGEDNGVLFLFSIEDREMRIEVGYGLEGLLTDAQSYWIEQNVAVPAFREGNYYSGAEGVTDKIIAAISGSEEIPAAVPEGAKSSLGDWIYFFLIIPVYLASVLGRSKSWWLGGVLGGAGGIVLGIIFGFLYAGIIAFALLVPLGLLFDFVVSRAYARGKATGRYPWWIGGGPHGGRGGFGGFGGGMSGGGGASSRW
ncbi:MAG: TPM domain-containing protein [Candidatus Brennerbacteria bacterium]|nr:TPM domain-containing protein [Candidatus Brennerbacteria bacterium]